MSNRQSLAGRIFLIILLIVVIILAALGLNELINRVSPVDEQKMGRTDVTVPPSSETAIPNVTPISTTQPSLEPTALITPNPTATLTSAPTLEPTSDPTPEVIVVYVTPTPEPTAVPTQVPTNTPDPTAAPTPVPTQAPTSIPTLSPAEIGKYNLEQLIARIDKIRVGNDILPNRVIDETYDLYDGLSNEYIDEQALFVYLCDLLLLIYTAERLTTFGILSCATTNSLLFSSFFIRFITFWRQNYTFPFILPNFSAFILLFTTFFLSLCSSDPIILAISAPSLVAILSGSGVMYALGKSRRSASKD